jgi:hypothetical protein
LSSSAVLGNMHICFDAFHWVSCPCCVSGRVWLTATHARCHVPVASVSFRSFFICPPCASPCITICFLGDLPTVSGTILSYPAVDLLQFLFFLANSKSYYIYIHVFRTLRHVILRN